VRERAVLAGPLSAAWQSSFRALLLSKLEPLLERSACSGAARIRTSMSQNNSSIVYVGLDVAKSSLQLDLPNQSQPLPNDPKGHARVLKLLRAFPHVQVICEASGGYERGIVHTLHSAGVLLSVVEAGRVRHFARAKGQRAKTDPIDASVLSAYGRAVAPAPTSAPTELQSRLAALSGRRLQLMQTLIAEGNRAEHYTDRLSVRQNRQLRRLLEKQIEECETAIAKLISSDKELESRAARLDAIPGVGAITAATVLAEVPELGRISNEAAAALVGVAPYNRDSGDQRGQRHIAGGRAVVRCALYMSALSAIRYDRILKTFYMRLRQAGKKPKVAVVACMRKLVVLMNRLLKNPQFQLAP
jgi:transposase